MPSQEEINDRLPLINFKNIELKKETLEVFLNQRGMKIGLGSVGQGYTVDQIVLFLKQKGHKSGYVDASGDIHFWGTKPYGSLWTAAIRDPRDKQKIIGRVYGTNFSITTCGDDEKFFIKNGKRIHHIIDPKTGLSSDKARQVTVISKSTLFADAWDTASFVLGVDKAMPILNKKHLASFFVNKENKVIISKNLILKTNSQWGDYYELPSDLK